MKFVFIVLFFCSAVIPVSQPHAAEAVPEYYLFKVPQLPLAEPAPLSWFFIRSGYYWNGTDLINFADIQWPSWDTQQIPLSLLPPLKQKSSLLIFDQDKALLEELPLDAAFSPEAYYEKATNKPAFFQIKLLAGRSRVEFISPIYSWYTKRKIASCEIDVSSELDQFLEQKNVSVCLSTLKSYLQDEGTTQQLYFVINWPIVKGRENISGVQSLERELKAAARKKRAQLFANKTRSKVFRAEVGLTQVEKLPHIGFPLAQIGSLERAEIAPDNKEIKRIIYSSDYGEGAKLTLFGFYDDLEKRRKIESPHLGDRRIVLQLVDRPSSSVVPPGEESRVEVIETRSLQKRTGLFGFLRPWSLRMFGGWNYLSSSRGENNEMFGFPGFELSYHPKSFSFQPYLSYESGVLSQPSNLVIGEVKAGVAKKTEWFSGSFYSLGFHRYTLSGKNPGSTRLGGLNSLSLGLGAKYRFEDWFVKPFVSGLIGNSFSYDSRLDVGRFFRTGTDYDLYFGGYVGYTAYRSRVENQVRESELFGEDRMHFGFSIGWMGPDSF